MKIIRKPSSGGTPYQKETYTAEASGFQPDDCIEYEFLTGGFSRQSKYRVQLPKCDFEFLIRRMLEISPIATCDAFNKALKAKLREPKKA